MSTGTHAGHEIAINAPAAPDEGERPPAGYSPVELLLAGAGACAAWDVVQMLRKRRLSLRDVAVEVEGDQADEPPWHYQRIALHFRVECDRLTESVLERVVRLAIVRYCGVLGTVRGVASIEATLELVASDGTSAGRRQIELALPAEALSPAEVPKADEGED